LLIEWKNFPPKKRTRIMSQIEVEAGEISWENMPVLEDTN